MTGILDRFRAAIPTPWRRSFDKVRAAARAVLAAAILAGGTELAGVNWAEVIAAVPVPDWVRAPLVLLIGGGIAVLAARLKREGFGYGAGVPRPPDQAR